MSGHNKWSSIKHRKGAQDAKRSKVFTKVIKEITVAARMGGGDIASNPRLRAAIAWGKTVNMPSGNIQNAIKKGTGELKGQSYETIIYEGFGPHNVAVIVECLTDNRNRTVSSVRAAFNKNNGNLGSTNSVMFMFDQIGLITVDKFLDEDSLTEYALDSGAEDIDTNLEDAYEIRTAPADLHTVTTYLEEKGIEIKNSQLTLIPQNMTEISETAKARQVLNFLNMLEDDDDVQKVSTNFDISEQVLKELNSE